MLVCVYIFFVTAKMLISIDFQMKGKFYTQMMHSLSDDIAYSIPHLHLIFITYSEHLSNALLGLLW